jgi:hypothetical protein
MPARRTENGGVTSQLGRENAEARRAAREKARQARADRRSAAVAWCHARTVDLLFIPVIGVPAVLSWTGMADYSIAGVIAHQLITAGPRRSRADRAQDQIDRAVSRRERTARRAAVRSARIQLDGSGQAHLVFEAGTATLSGKRLRRRLAFADHDHLQNYADRQPARVDRTAVVAELADQIRDAVRSGDIWRPNYSAMMAATGRKRFWREKVVHDARGAVLEFPADMADDERTG